jgi:hypothetical protein
MGKLFNIQAATAFFAFSNGDKAGFEKYRDRSMVVLDSIADVLSGCPSYSINKTIREACSVPGHNAKLPEMIRWATIQSDYTTNDVYEQFGGYYIPRMKSYFEVLEKKLAAGDASITKADMADRLKEISDHYRRHGWSSRAKPAEPLSAVSEHFKTFAAWACDKQAAKIEAAFRAKNKPDPKNAGAFDFVAPDRTDKQDK